jgi:hypothetical protein
MTLAFPQVAALRAKFKLARPFQYRPSPALFLSIVHLPAGPTPKAEARSSKNTLETFLSVAVSNHPTTQTDYFSLATQD